MKQPKIIILDIGNSVAAFNQASKPFVQGTEIITTDMIDQLWEAFYIEDIIEQKIPSVISDIAQNSDLCLSDREEAQLAQALDKLACDIARQVYNHKLYPPSGILPYYMDWTANYQPFLRYCGELEASQ